MLKKLNNCLFITPVGKMILKPHAKNISATSNLNNQNYSLNAMEFTLKSQRMNFIITLYIPQKKISRWIHIHYGAFIKA